MSHPFQRIPAGKLRYLGAPITALSAVLLIAVLAMPGPGDLPALVAAGSPARARAILGNWTELDRVHVAWKNGFDYFLMVSFSNALALVSIWASRQFSRPVLVSAGVVFAWLAWVSILLDVPENVAYLNMIRGSVEQPWPALAAGCFLLKSSFQVATVGYFFVALAVRSSTRREERSTPRAAV
jgi:hypothetical protein